MNIHRIFCYSYNAQFILFSRDKDPIDGFTKSVFEDAAPESFYLLMCMNTVEAISVEIV